MLAGELVLTVEHAENLAQVDWKDTCAFTGTTKQDFGRSVVSGNSVMSVKKGNSVMSVKTSANAPSDPYILVTLYPESPSSKGELNADVRKSKTLINDDVPTWNERMTFDFCWRQEGVLARRESERKSVLKKAGYVKTDAEPIEDEIYGVLPKIQNDITALQGSIPAALKDMQNLRETMQDILVQLGVQNQKQKCASDCTDGRLPDLDLSLCTPPHILETKTSEMSDQKQPESGNRSDKCSGSEQATARSGADCDFKYVVPGVVPEDVLASTGESQLPEDSNR